MSKLENWQRAIREGEEVGIVTSATPKPRAGELEAWHSKNVESHKSAVFNEARLGDEIARVWGMHGAHMEVFKMIQAERDLLRERERELVGLLELAETLRPALLKSFGYVPEYVLDFCNRSRALAKHGALNAQPR